MISDVVRSAFTGTSVAVFMVLLPSGCSRGTPAGSGPSDSEPFLLVFQEYGGIAGETREVLVISSDREISLDDIPVPSPHIRRHRQVFVVSSRDVAHLESLVMRAGFHEWSSFDTRFADAVAVDLQIRSGGKESQVIIEDVTDSRADVQQALEKLKRLVDELRRAARRYGSELRR